ncbi:MAG: chromosomal replication initiator protein DnaA [Candidatus Nitrohelix vancouverensis]|uniref:Chromosomal replication initiator protein DnaA n=1 Tax=Candidatus Nitrohelix vancouverensis TaxID=2705534 RepID=A0A7T0C136_9BACT|nr:MAG: chromosomal replication initiator protein DnaA [Candidatus Nitrohelix vancouverensis]
MNSPDVLWNRCLDHVKSKIHAENYATWFSPTYIRSYEENSFLIAVPNYFYKKCLEENYLDLIQESVKKVTGAAPEIDFYIDPEFGEEQENSSPVIEIPAPTLSAERMEQGPASTLNPKFTFSSFVVGSSNQFAQAAAQAVAKNPAMAYNPLFLYGGVGLGKTHLLHAIGNEILRNNSNVHVRYLTAEQFTVDLIESLRKDRMPDFRAKYRPLDVLLVDDIQFIAGKERTQEEFFYTFNALYESHKQVVLSSDRYPKEIHNIEERLRSRFESGLIADIKLPDLETKVAILERKAEFHKKNVPNDVNLFIASNIKTNIRELEGLLLRIIAFASFTRKEITLELAKDVLKDFTYDKNKNFNVPKILKIVASHYNLKVSDLKSKKRSRNISVPRQIAMYLSREYTQTSLPEIGKQFGGKDHTTVLYSYRQISNLIKESSDISGSVQSIIKKIERE